jgi:hypothetical protein
VIPLIEWDRVRYSVPTDCLGQLVEVRRRVDADELTIRLAGRVVATHRIPTDGTVEVWDPAHRAAAEVAALGSTRRRHLRVVTDTQPPSLMLRRLELGAGDFDVATPDLGRYDQGDLA